MRAVAIAEDRSLQPTTSATSAARTGCAPTDFEDAVQLLTAGKLPADELITGTAPMDRAQEMFERLESPATEDVKILLSPAG
jgi:threonine dehydrogenase-like Zn-dependent dehydrogenase